MMVKVQQLVIMRCWDCRKTKFAAIGDTVQDAITQAERIGWTVGRTEYGMNAACPSCREKAIALAREGAAEIGAWLESFGGELSIT